MQNDTERRRLSLPPFPSVPFPSRSKTGPSNANAELQGTLSHLPPSLPEFIQNAGPKPNPR